MSKIKQLSLQEIQKIAAGQVVDRPANIVKELIENSLDAGATKISLYVHNGGQSKIRIIDNGHGMNAQDAVLCFERHATSKISSFDQLESLQTFGFRGEALYSIAAISSVILTTKEPDALEGTFVHIKDGALREQKNVVCDTGTEIVIENIFENVPGRKNFLQKKETELRVITQLFQAFCFSHCHVHFQLFSEDRLLYNCLPTKSVLDKSSVVWQDGAAHSCMPLLPNDNSFYHIDGIISDKQFYRYNRNHIFFFVNKRWIKNYSLYQALLKGYENVLPQGRSPIAVINLTVNPQELDINIHPRKEEVKFQHPKRIENQLYELVKQTLQEKNKKQLLSTHALAVAAPMPEFIVPSRTTTSLQSSFNQPSRLSTPFVFSDNSYEDRQHNQKKISMLHDDMFFKKPEQVIASQDMNPEPEKSNESIADAEHVFKVVGILKKTYILLETQEGMLMIDQHAAHERILYERFRKRFEAVPSIALLFPVNVTLTAHDTQIIMEHALFLHEYGIVLDQLSTNSVIIRAVPTYLKNVDWALFLHEIINIVHEQDHNGLEDNLEHLHNALQAQMACKAAVKAGDFLSDEQVAQLLKDLYALENKCTCPHGRPTQWLVNFSDIEKNFKRRK